MVSDKFTDGKKQSFIKKAYRYGRKYVDYRMGVAGALVMASIVFYINYSSTGYLLGSTTAALKQGTYTFFFGGVIMRLSERLATEISRKGLALVAACVIPSILSLALTFGMHNLKGTPKPFESTIPTAVFVIPSTAVWGTINRKKLEKRMNKKNIS